MISEQTRDIVRQGKKVYETRLRPTLEASHLNKFLAIEPDSGEYFFGDTFSEAIQAAHKAHPDRISYTLRIGHPAALHLGLLATRSDVWTRPRALLPLGMGPANGQE